MDGFLTQLVETLGPEPLAYWGSFQCNGTSNPSSTTFRAPPGLAGFTVAYSATGVFTITLPAGLTLPSQAYSIIASPQFAVLATDWFDCAVLGESTLNSTTRQFVVQAHRSGTGQAPANTAGNRINFAIFATNSTGK
jgi:hypothetical protein